MKTILKYTLIGLLVVAVASIPVVSIAYAQGDGPDTQNGLAELLGMTREELRGQLQDGKTLEELADAAGVDLDTYREEMRQTRQSNLETRIEEALANGEISQDQADWLMEGLEKGFLDGPFIGLGGRRPGSQPDLDGAGMPGIRGGKSARDQ